MMIPSIQYITFTDELCALLFGVIALCDCIFNNNWKKYRLLWFMMAIMTFYAIYSLTALNENVPIAIITDWIIELKPFVPFCVIFAIEPTFTNQDKRLIKRICIFNSAVLCISLMLGAKATIALVFHLTYAGTIIFTSMLFYLYCSLTPEGQLPKQTRNIITIFLTFGLLCFRSKYYGIYIITIFFLYFYRPGIMRHFSVKHAMALILLAGIVFAVSWKKINFYFISGNGDSFDPRVIESFARPVLYKTAGTILFDYFPFGTGLASFASFGSAKWYSNVYYEYGIHTVHGLSPNEEFNFICDAFYASLAQFGVVGLILFIWFWMYAYSFLRHAIRIDAKRYKSYMIVCALFICFILIECIAGNTFTQVVGMNGMCLFGVCCAYTKKTIKEYGSDCHITPKLNPILRKI